MNQHIVIIGAGFSGLGMAMRLRRAGITDFTLLERANRVGGTWRDNHYPGAACDVESHLYSFSFEPNPSWTRTFAPQGEILAYLERCVEKYDLRPHLRLNCAVTGAELDESNGLWSVRTSQGDTLSARLVIAGCGPLNRPALPDIPGLGEFKGAVFHSSDWDHGCSLAGKTVAVIGTGASAIQIVPEVAKEVKQLHVFQRTAPWVLPKPDGAIPSRHRSRFERAPWRQRWARGQQFWKHELLSLAFVGGTTSRVLRYGQKVARRHIEQHVANPALRAKLTPDFSMGCKRVLLSNDYYPALARPNVEVVTEPIASLGERSVRTADGRDRPLDALVLATGFQAAESVAPFAVKGAGGRDLNEVWNGAPEAYLGTAVAGFPNLFLLVGPNTGLGATSMILMIEAQLTYLLDAVQTMRARGWRSLEVRGEAQSAFNTALARRLGNTVWASGCKAWYTTRTGRNTTLWPGTTLEFRHRTRRFDTAAYRIDDLAAAHSRPPSAEPREVVAPGGREPHLQATS